MQSACPRPVQQPRATLAKLAIPTKVLRFDSLERQTFHPRNIGVVCVDDGRDSPQMLHHVTTSTQQPPELLLKGMPLLLTRTQVRRILSQRLEFAAVYDALACHPTNGVAGGIGRHLIRSAAWRLVLQPSISCCSRSKLVRNCQHVILQHQLFKAFHGVELRLIRRKLRSRLMEVLKGAATLQ